MTRVSLINVRRGTAPVAKISLLLLLLLLPAGSAVAAPTVLKQGFTVNLATAKDGTANDMVVTYGP